MTPTRVLVVEDNDATAAFICQQFRERGLVPDAVRNGLEALRKAYSQQFGLAVVNVAIKSEPDGGETADWLRRLYGVPVVVFSISTPTDAPSQAGVTAQVAALDAQQLLSVVSRVLPAVLSRRTWSDLVREVGEVFTHPARSDRPVAQVSSRPYSQAPKVSPVLPPGFAELSGREWQIIHDLIDDPSAHAVALKRQRSPHTVHNHLKSIYRKLRVHSVAELLSLMIRLSREVPSV